MVVESKEQANSKSTEEAKQARVAESAKQRIIRRSKKIMRDKVTRRQFDA